MEMASYHQMNVSRTLHWYPKEHHASRQLLCNSVTSFSKQEACMWHSFLCMVQLGHWPWLCAVCIVWTWCRPWASRTEWAGTQWAEGCTDAPAPSSAWLPHEGPSSPEPRIEPDGGSKGQHDKGEEENTMTLWIWIYLDNSNHLCSDLSVHTE